MTENTKTMIADLRRMADWLEANDMPVGNLAYQNLFMFYLTSHREEFARLARKIGSTGEKKGTEMFATFRKRFGSVYYDLTIDRELVCRRIVTGTHIVPAQPEHVVPAQPEHVVEDVRYECDSWLNPATLKAEEIQS